jgi:hypothetical protein
MHFAESVEGAGPDQPCTVTTAPPAQRTAASYTCNGSRDVLFRGRFVQYQE